MYLASSPVQFYYCEMCNGRHDTPSGNCTQMADSEMQVLTSAWDTLSDEALRRFEDSLGS